MSKEEAKKPTKRQLEILTAMQDGKPLMRQFGPRGGVEHFIEGSGEVRSDVVMRMVEAGFIREANDGMFGVSQSYEVCHEAAL